MGPCSPARNMRSVDRCHNQGPGSSRKDRPLEVERKRQRLWSQNTGDRPSAGCPREPPGTTDDPVCALKIDWRTIATVAQNCHLDLQCRSVFAAKLELDLSTSVAGRRRDE